MGMGSLQNDLAKLEPALRQRLGAAQTLEDVFSGFRGQLGQLKMVAQDEFSQDLWLPLDSGFLVVGVT